MFEILPESTETSIGVKVSGKLTAEDYDLLLPKLDEGIAVHGKINLLMVFGDFVGWDDLDAAQADYKLGTSMTMILRRNDLSIRSKRGIA